MVPDRLNCLDGKPLHGRRIVITRARAQSAAFARAIEELGGEVIDFPTIEILPPRSYAPLDRAIQGIEKYHWIVFTSVNGVRHFLARMQHLERDVLALKRTIIAAIGPQTARGLESVGLRVHLVPKEYRAEAILKEMRPEEMRGKRVLLPRAAQAREILPKTLRDWGAQVDVVQAYRTVAAKSDAPRVRSLLAARKVDMITFTSSSTVAHFARLVADGKMRGLLAHTPVACIGPITQKRAQDLGLRVEVIAREYTIAGLTEAIKDYFKMQSAK